MTRKDSPAWKGDAVGYAGAHTRLKNLRGKASIYDCVDCGAPAVAWSYHYGCSEERRQETFDSGWFITSSPYCLHFTEHYSPRCTPCHASYDKARRVLVPPRRNEGEWKLRAGHDQLPQIRVTPPK